MKKFLLLLISIFIGLVAANFIAGFYFRYLYGTSYYRKAIVTKKINKLSASKLKQYLENSDEFELVDEVPKPVVSIDVPIESFQQNASKESVVYKAEKIILRQSKKVPGIVLDAAYKLSEAQLQSIIDNETSLAFAVYCESDKNANIHISLAIDQNEVVSSPKKLFEKDLLLAVLPARKKPKSAALNLKIICSNFNSVVLKQPKIILTPMEPPALIRNFLQKINLKKGKKVRIVTLGGSTTYGVGADYNTAWPAILQQRLNYFYPDKFEVLNLALWGASARDFLESYDRLLVIRYGADKYLEAPKAVEFVPRYKFGYKDLEPDIVLIAPCWNDVAYYLIHPSYDSNFIFGKSFRNIDQSLQGLCKYPLGFFLYTAVNKIMFSSLIPFRSNEKREIINKLKDCDESTIYAQILELSGKNQGMLDNLKNNYAQVLDKLCLKFKSQNVYTQFVSLPTMAFLEYKGELGRSKKKLGWKEDFFTLSTWAYVAGGTKENEAMREVSARCQSGFSDMLRSFKDYPFEEKDAIFSDTIHLSDLGNNYVSAIIFHDIGEKIGEEVKHLENI